MGPEQIAIGILALVGLILAVAIAVLLISYLLVPLFRGVAWVLARIFHFIIGELRDIVRFVGALLAMLLFSPLVLLNIVIGRWSASAHFANAVKGELSIAGACLYRAFLAHPARLVGAGGLVEGIEQRFPQAIAQAPTRDQPKGRSGQFEGYKIVGSLPTGGSGSKLYIAEPDPIKRAALERSGFRGVDQVVIKSFAVDDGSNLPNIVRESRALEAAKKLGLVLDHELSPAKFYYVMRYVPGQPLNVVIQQMHAQSDPSLNGLDDRHLRTALGYLSDLVAMLHQYHKGGLWHKDVKPENIIVEQLAGTPRAHLVDFGLVTPLRSAMTLTTHGTEYFRDPELVRLALRGVKVHEVDGSKFDVYAAGAVLFATMDNNFPAHGVLSQVSHRCPEAIKWIIRRAMADYDKRYVSAAQMLADIDVVRLAPDPFGVRPIDLPSMKGDNFAPIMPEPEAAFAAASPSAFRAQPAAAVPPPFSNPQPETPGKKKRPDIRLLNWWTGEHVVVPEIPAAAASEPSAQPGPFGFDSQKFQDFARNAGQKAEEAIDRAFVAAGFSAQNARVRHAGAPGRTAREQVEAARARIQAKREKMKAHRSGWSGMFGTKVPGHYSNKPGAGSFASSIILIGGVVFLFLILRGDTFIWKSSGSSPSAAVTIAAPAAARDGAMETIRLASGTDAEKTVAKSSRKSRNSAKSQPKSEPAPLTVEGSKALFVSDLPSPLTPASVKTIAAVVDNLRRTGFDLSGDTPDVKPDDQETVNHLAEARVAVSGVEIASDEFRDRLSQWIGEKNMDIVIWLRPQTDKAGKPDAAKPPIAYVVASAQADVNTRDAARDAIANAFREAK